MKLLARPMLSLVILVVGLFSAEVSAQSCTSYAQEMVSWVAQTNYDDKYYLTVKGTTLTPHAGNNGLVSRIQGTVDRHTAGSWANGVWLPAKVSTSTSSPSRQLFDDRFNGSQPFYVSAYDLLGITLDDTGKITTTADSWGGGVTTITPIGCQYGIIYGFSSDGTLWAFKFSKKYFRIPGFSQTESPDF